VYVRIDQTMDFAAQQPHGQESVDIGAGDDDEQNVVV